MAIEIKSIPLLEGRVAKAFIKKADSGEKKRATVDYSNQVVVSRVILEKAKLH